MGRIPKLHRKPDNGTFKQGFAPPRECPCGCGQRIGLIFTVIDMDGYRQPGRYCEATVKRGHL